MTGHWKHSIGYVLQDKCPTNFPMHLPIDCIELLHTESLNALAVGFHGTLPNQNIARMLGCELKVSEFQTWVLHLEKESSKAHVIFHACHMIKLMRNPLVMTRQSAM